MDLGKFLVICGHYGSGKTNFTLNLAREFARLGEAVTVVDMDIVNPYFRSSDYTGLLETEGIKVIAPSYAGSTLDVPALSPEIYSVFDSEQGRVIFDVGGDDSGAVALGRFAPQLRESGYQMLYVINRYRSLIQDPEDAAALLRDICAASRLSPAALINNSHLGNTTTAQTVLDSVPYAEEVSRITHLPVAFQTGTRAFAEELRPILSNYYPVDVLVTPPW